MAQRSGNGCRDDSDKSEHWLAFNVLPPLRLQGADIMRGQHDGAVGRQDEYPHIPGFDWPAYVTKLTKLADRFG